MRYTVVCDIIRQPSHEPYNAHLCGDVMAHAGNGNPTIFDDMPTKRPHFFFLIVGRQYFALKKWESKFVANVFRHVARSNSSIERLGKYPALFTTISTSPTSWVFAAAERHCSSCVTSS